ncbi:MAG: hypothetical protein ACP5N7_03920 [Candidatus Pacearchaeota archaeon]
MKIKVNTSVGAVSEAPKTFEIVFTFKDGNLPSELSLWISEELTAKELIGTLLNFIGKIVSTRFQ